MAEQKIIPKAIMMQCCIIALTKKLVNKSKYAVSYAAALSSKGDLYRP
jgi:hypothetical protein